MNKSNRPALPARYRPMSPSQEPTVLSYRGKSVSLTAQEDEELKELQRVRDEAFELYNHRWEQLFTKASIRAGVDKALPKQGLLSVVPNS